MPDARDIGHWPNGMLKVEHLASLCLNPWATLAVPFGLVLFGAVCMTTMAKCSLTLFVSVTLFGGALDVMVALHMLFLRAGALAEVLCAALFEVYLQGDHL